MKLDFYLFLLFVSIVAAQSGIERQYGGIGGTNPTCNGDERSWKWYPNLCTDSACSMSGTSPTIGDIYQEAACGISKPAYTKTDWVYLENYFSDNSCTETTSTRYYGAIGPNGQCAYNWLGVRNHNDALKPYIKFTCLASSLVYEYCDDASCTQNCVSGSAPANNDQCFAGNGPSSQWYYKAYCPTVTTTTTTTTTTTSTTGNVPTLAPGQRDYSGSYAIQTQSDGETTVCNAESPCCCLTTTFSAVRSGSASYTVTDAPVIGQCPESSSTQTFTFTFPSTTSTKATFTFNGENYEMDFAENPFVGVVSTNANSECTSIAKCTGGNCDSRAGILGYSAAILIGSLFVVTMLF